MKRRELLSAAVAAGVSRKLHAAAPTALPATMKVTAQALANSPWDRHWDEFKGAIAQRPDIAPEYYLRGETGNEEQMLTALRRNRVQIGGITMWGLAGIIPEAAVPMMPYLFESAAEVDFVFDTALAPWFDARLQEKGLKFLLWSEVGWNVLYTRRPVLTPEDIRHMKIRGSPNFAAQAFLRAVGANPVALGIADIAPALQTGLADGGLSSLTFFYYSFRAFASDVTELNQSYDQGVQVANLDWWNGLDAGQRAAVAGAFVPIGRARAELRAHAETLKRELIAAGTRIHTLSPAQRAAWVAAAAATHTAILAEIGGRARELYGLIGAAQRAFVKKA
jgi:TRAP-type C4-dicarboxylate transport system substrate-binding protein